MDWAIMCGCNNDSSAHGQCGNLQIKAHRFAFISPAGAFQHFLSVSCSRTTPLCSLQDDLSSRLAARPSGSAPCPAAQHIHWLSAGWDLHTPLWRRVPGVWEEHGKCEKCLSRYTLKSTGSSRHRYPRHSLPGEHSKGTEGTVGDARLTALCSPREVLSLHFYPHGKVRHLQIMAALSAQPRSFSRKIEMPSLNIKSWVLLKDLLLILWILCPLKLR